MIKGLNRNGTLPDPSRDYASLDASLRRAFDSVAKCAFNEHEYFPKSDDLVPFNRKPIIVEFATLVEALAPLDGSEMILATTYLEKLSAAGMIELTNDFSCRISFDTYDILAPRIFAECQQTFPFFDLVKDTQVSKHPQTA